jgi:hypothetical protein
MMGHLFDKLQTHTSRRMRRPAPQLVVLNVVGPPLAIANLRFDMILLCVIRAPPLVVTAPLLAGLRPHHLEVIHRTLGSRQLLTVDRLSIVTIQIASLLRVRPCLPLFRVRP